MSVVQKLVYIELVKSALRELSDVEYQRRVWGQGSATEMSSMNEAAATLFNDSCLDNALEKNILIFSPEIDRELRELRNLLQSSLSAQHIYGTMEVLDSVEWMEICNRAARILTALP